MKIRGITASALVATALLSAITSSAFAQTKITIGLTQFNEVAPVMIAKEEGFFAKHGLDVDIQLIPLNSTLPAALQSDSIQIASLTPPVMVQAVDGSLDLVAIAGGAVGSKNDTNYGVVERNDAGIAGAADFVGKKVGVPGIGATLQVIFRKWLSVKGIDYSKVTFIETPFPQMTDMLKGGSVDAVVTANPFMGRITDADVGKIVSNMAPDLPNGLATFFYATTRDWATQNAETAKAFRESIAEAIAFAQGNLDGARTDFGKYVKLPQPVIAKIKFIGMNAEPTESSLATWISIMDEQKMLKTKIEAAHLILQ